MSVSIAPVVNKMALQAVNDATPKTERVSQAEKSGAASKTEQADKVDPKLAKLEETARQFEAIFVRQLLKTAKFGGQAAKGGHGQMAVDAMANSICDGGGLGLSSHIRDVLVKAHLAKASGGE